MAFKKYLAPMIAQLSGMAKFTVDLQVRHVSVDNPIHVTDPDVWIIDPKTFLRRSGEWNLLSSTRKGQPIQMIVILPPPEHTPLYVPLHDNVDDLKQADLSISFVYPKWGAVAILNRKTQDQVIGENELAVPFASLAGQLRSLLGIWYPHPAFWSDGKPFEAGWSSASCSAGIAPWEMDSILGIHTVWAYRKTLETLSALSRLLSAIPELPFERDLKGRTDETLLLLSRARQSLADGHLEQAYRQALDALQLARSVFFHPSMVGRLYFSQDHKFGVYLPIFAPILPALSAAAFRSLRHLRFN